MKANKPLLEICVDSEQSCLAAAEGGADRLELCGHLVIGGVTPSAALLRQARRAFHGEIRAIVRPRFGDFLYSRSELEQMRQEIVILREEGADGVVLGALTPEGEPDAEALSELSEAAKGMKKTFHRAFDLTRDPFSALECAVLLGFDTILTSGQAPSAYEGRALIRELITRAAGRIDVMAGAGVTQDNLLFLHEETGGNVFHASAKRALASGMRFRRPEISMGVAGLSEYTVLQADREEIAKMAELVRTFGEK